MSNSNHLALALAQVQIVDQPNSVLGFTTDLIRLMLS